jgi:microcystin-dependent protein
MSRNYRSIAEPKTLNGNVTNIATQITLNNITGLPSPPYVLVINPDTANEEAVLVTTNQDGVTAPTLKVERAIETGATARTHTDQDVVRHMIVGSDLQLAHDHIDLTEAHGATGAVVGTTNTQTLTNKTLTTPKINENVTVTATSTELNVLDGITASTAELNYTDGVTSAIQTQINTKAPSADPTFTGTVVLPSTTSIGTVSATELGYVDGVTSAIQTQLNTIVNTTIPNATPTGTVVMWVTADAPTGWLLCNGTEQLITSFPTLDGVLGTTYGIRTNGSGAAGTTHFRLPDLRGRVPMGAGTGRNVADSANLTARTLGTKVSDAEEVTLDTTQIPSHTHSINPAMIVGGGHVNSPSTGTAYSPVGDNPTSAVSITNTGGGLAHNNTQPSTVINFIIKT